MTCTLIISLASLNAIVAGESRSSQIVLQILIITGAAADAWAFRLASLSGEGKLWQKSHNKKHDWLHVQSRDDSSENCTEAWEFQHNLRQVSFSNIHHAIKTAYT